MDRAGTTSPRLGKLRTANGAEIDLGSGGRGGRVVPRRLLSKMPSTRTVRSGDPAAHEDSIKPMQISFFGDDAPLVPRSDLLENPVFWALHVPRGSGSPDELPELFGVDVDDLEDVHRLLFDEQRWPAFSLPVPEGVLHIVYANDPDDGAVLRTGPPGHARRLEDLIRPAQLGHFLAQLGEFLLLGGRRPVGALAAVGFGLTHPVPQSLRVNTQVTSDVSDRTPGLLNEPHGPFPQLIRVLTWRSHR